MQRREFLHLSAAATCLGSATSLAAEEANVAAPEYYEWRTYQIPSEDKQALLTSYLEEAALPAWERLGIGPVGVFTETGPEATASVHVLLPYVSIEVFAGERQGLEQDTTYQQAAADYLGAPQQDPTFDRIDSSLMVAFAGMPKMSPPERLPRIFELREYQSHSEAKARRKIEMFNNGEIPIFLEAGFKNVFFGETLVGPRLPNLKYLLASETMEANQQSWQQFREHPKWVSMKDLPEYAETVSKVIQTFLLPTAFSQV
ncbi:NIPSNAP family protein [Bythopirellula polymerisocia]|uniref:NIPSNAP domain-containing protein n=1 Tax=Bythopirellula polymerisocia TaxID=2528003 RepID=A0A5C6CYR6_9BACT|nr:NIPSNAP family protein [Bythopirellula polymerisocia]TWU28136.1 hypothetical protein Pla144_14230 [Bythopirellula polymerisocia]